MFFGCEDNCEAQFFLKEYFCFSTGQNRSSIQNNGGKFLLTRSITKAQNSNHRSAKFSTSVEIYLAADVIKGCKSVKIRRRNFHLDSLFTGISAPVTPERRNLPRQHRYNNSLIPCQRRTPFVCNF